MKPRVSFASARWTLTTSAREKTASGVSTASTPNSCACARACRGIAREAPAPGNDRHAERAGAARDFLGDVAEADQPERPAEQSARLGELLLVPAPAAQIDDVVRNAAIERQHQREGELGHRDGVLARAVRHVDAAARRGRDVDRVDARSRAHDQRQPAAVHHRFGDLGRAHDQHLRAAASPAPPASASPFRFGIEDHLAAERAKAVEAGLFEFVCDEDGHGLGRVGRVGRVGQVGRVGRVGRVGQVVRSRIDGPVHVQTCRLTPAPACPTRPKSDATAGRRAAWVRTRWISAA